MTTWTSDELNKIGRAEEIQVASLRRDGRLRNPVTIWVVRLGDDLYVRSVHGRIGSWFRGIQARHEGHIRAGGVDKDVTFVEDGDPTINEQIDAAYRASIVLIHLLLIISIAPPRGLRRSNLCPVHNLFKLRGHGRHR